MTPRLYLFSAGLLVLVAATLLLARFWPVDESDASLRQKAADVIGLIGGLLALLSWVALKLPRLLLAARRQAIR